MKNNIVPSKEDISRPPMTKDKMIKAIATTLIGLLLLGAGFFLALKVFKIICLVSGAVMTVWGVVQFPHNNGKGPIIR